MQGVDATPNSQEEGGHPVEPVLHRAQSHQGGEVRSATGVIGGIKLKEFDNQAD